MYTTYLSDFPKWNRIYHMTFNSMYFFYFSMLGFLLVGWAVLALVAARRLSLVAASESYSSCRVWASHSVASLITEHGLKGMQALAAVVHDLSCPIACEIFLNQGSNLWPCIGRQMLKHWTTREAPREEILWCPCCTFLRTTLLQNTLILPCCDCSPLKGELG